MNIGFPPSSNGIYNNAGNSRRLATYLEHEDLERIEKGVYTEGFFNLIEENIYKSQVVKDIDSNIGQLMKTDAKFYAIHVSPSAKELQIMGNTEQEQAEAMRRYIREVFIPEYAKNFNKGLTEEDIKFYGKIHFYRDRSENNQNNMHCHIIVSRKDQSNKKKLSPLTNHKNTKKGVVKGGFDRTELFKNVEKGFDRLFSYERPLAKTFEYYNVMKNGTITEQLRMQERMDAFMTAHKQIGKDASLNQPITQQPNEPVTQSNNESLEQSISTPDLILSSTLEIFTQKIHEDDLESLKKVEEIKRKNKGFKR